MSNSINLDWNAIRPLNGSRSEGFEELCAQLARAETPPGCRFERKGTPDGGVECYAILNDGTEWGWQAKYFDSLGESQWTQIDDSIKTALEQHPRLARYYVCVPLNRPDARAMGTKITRKPAKKLKSKPTTKSTKKSAKERWDDHEKKWSGWAAARGMSVEFIYWGSSELLERLARPEHVGRVCFWFNIQGFNQTWFLARLEEALKAAGPRYTPEIHINLPIAAEFEAFGRTVPFFDRLKARALPLREKLRSVSIGEPKGTDPGIRAATASLERAVRAVLEELGAIVPQATGSLSLLNIVRLVEAAVAASAEVERLLVEPERTHDQQSPPDEKRDARAAPPLNPYRERRRRLWSLSSELGDVRDVLQHADTVAGGALMVLTGTAGSGKTHLLCDIARKRITAGQPTVLLMGQRFVGTEEPWVQALRQLDLSAIRVEEFIGALESAAQAAGCRALLMIDALNEGAGRTIWSSNLAAFLAHVERTPWIAVTLSVRSSYEEVVVPSTVKARAVSIAHDGFADHEYDATRTFFMHYGLDLPSTPLLAPEFRNPLFLKTLCSGLSARGERHLPRGFHGITAVFDLYLTAINGRLASELGFNPKTPYVRRALESVCDALFKASQRWLPMSDAEATVNALLPGREFERSLYRGLVSEGILVEEIARGSQPSPEAVVFIAYERFADHVISKILVDRYLDPADPTATFSLGQPLAFLSDEKTYVEPGLIEALCIQVAERTGHELVKLAPGLLSRWGISDAFRQSLIWRATSAFSDETRSVLNDLCTNTHALHDTLNVLLTVATLPGHPLNAEFLDKRLRKDTMADRDAWWSTYLHEAWGRRGAVDRLVDWASAVVPSTALEDEAIDLCAVGLAWMLTTSNRYLRDRATKALASLLTGRLLAVARLVERFADVDDPYVTERVYAVAYATAMRCHSPTEVGALASVVYTRVFEKRNPPTHVLLRDYARGVIERAIYLGADIDLDTVRIRPPYESKWPSIPTEEEIKPLLPGWSKGDHDGGELEWARNRIGSSVMADDFAFYVIGTNSSSTSSRWLSLSLNEPKWQQPARPEDLLRDLVSEFSSREKRAWKAFQEARKLRQSALSASIGGWVARPNNSVTSVTIEPLPSEISEEPPSEIEALNKNLEEAEGRLESALTEDHARRLNEIVDASANYEEARTPPGFDLRQIQRYILKRVFELGWTTARFGQFDHFAIGYHGREASKAERIGKKYQWIAYHEILALIADHYQHRDRYQDDKEDQVYEGPWQDYLRNIDPSCTLRSARGGTAWDSHTRAWWGATEYKDWGDPDDLHSWVNRYEDFPPLEKLLSVTDPQDKSRWLNAQCHFIWRQQTPADQESTDVDSRELWYICTGYLIREEDAEAFMEWAEGVDFWGNWMVSAPNVYPMFLAARG